MKKIQRSWDILTEKQREETVQDIQKFFENETGEELGVFVAEDFLDTLLQEMGKNIYNKGVEDATNTLNENIQDLNINLSVLLKK